MMESLEPRAYLNAVLVEDINQLPDSSLGPTTLVTAGSYAYFVHTDVDHGIELWKTDGTEAGTSLVEDIRPGITNSSPTMLTDVAGTLMFVVDDGVNGAELWKSDGTETGTSMVKDIRAGSGGASISNLTHVNGVAYFAADDGSGEGIELWKSDGTEAGTAKVKDINLGSGSSSPSGFVGLNGTVYFAANGGSGTGIELWKTDGTSLGTSLVKDINLGSANSNPIDLVASNGLLYFGATTASAGRELWVSDGTGLGTSLVVDIAAGTSWGYQGYLTDVSGTLFFRGFSPAAGSELWKSDGTAIGTALVKDLLPGTSSSAPANLLNYNGTLVFVASDGVAGQEVIRSDGTLAGTYVIKDIFPGGTSQTPPANFTIANGNLFFSAQDAMGLPIELWKTDGTEAGTSKIEINPGPAASNPASFANLNGTLLLAATNKTTGGREIWRSDGSQAGTQMVKDVWLGTAGSHPSGFIELNGSAIFAAEDGTYGAEIWKSDGTAAGTALLKDLRVGTDSSGPNAFTRVGDTVFFVADDGVNGRELWKTDGTETGTSLVRNIAAGAVGSSPSGLIALGDRLYFTANDGISGTELWISDGTEAGTVPLKDIWAGSTGSFPGNLVRANDRLFFTANDGVAGSELWMSDGTSSGTVLVRDTVPGSGSFFTSWVAAVGNRIFFVADGANGSGSELWTSDGTAAGTAMVKDIETGASGSIPRHLIDINGTLFFTAMTSAFGRELWKSDGTAAGTVMVKDAAPGVEFGIYGSETAMAAHMFAGYGGLLYYAGMTNGAQTLWRSDGTEAGTFMLNSVMPNLPRMGGVLSGFVNTVFFSASDALGPGLWKSDGTIAGTAFVKDINPGSTPTISNPFATVGARMFFSAANRSSGQELFLLSPPNAFIESASVNEGDSVSLSGANSFDPDPGETLTWSWDLDGDNIFGETGGAATRGDEVGVSPTFSAAGLDGPSTYTVKLKVTNGVGLVSDVAERAIGVTDVDPTLTIGGDASVDEGATYTLSLGVIDPGSDTISQWVINWGDGSAPETIPSNPSSATHTFAHGSYTRTITATATDEDGTFNSNSKQVTVNAVNPPAAPTGLAVSGVTSAQIDLTWTDNSGNDAGFLLERRLGTTGAWQQIATAPQDATSYSDTGRTPGRTYNYRVRATNAVGASGYSAIVSATTTGSETRLSGTPFGTNSYGAGFEFDKALDGNTSTTFELGVSGAVGIDLGQDNADAPTRVRLLPKPGFQGYLTNGVIQGSNTDSTSGFTTLLTIPAGAINGWNEYFIEGAAAYRYVRFVSASQTYVAELELYTALPAGVPAAPTSLAATAASAGQLDLTWTDNSSDETGFRLERKRGATGTWAPVITLAGGVTSYSDTGLLTGNTYYYRLRADNATGHSAYTGEVSATTQGSLQKLTGMVFGSAWNAIGAEPAKAFDGSTSTPFTVTGPWPGMYAGIDLGVSHTSVIDRVRIFPGTAGPQHLVGAEIQGSNTSLTTGFVTLATISTVRSGWNEYLLAGATAYRFLRVVSTSTQAHLAEIEFYSAAQPGVPAAPASLSATAVSPTQVDLAWADNATNETGFRIERRHPSDASAWATVATVGAGATAYSDTAVIAGANYLYRVRAENAQGHSVWSPEAAVTAQGVLSKISGAIITSYPSSWFNPGNPPSNAFDGNTSTLAWYHGAAGGAIGIDLGAGKAFPLHKARILPGSSTYFATGGKFQGSNTSATSGWVDLATIPTDPQMVWNELYTDSTTAYRYYRYISAATQIPVYELEFYTLNNAPSATINGTYSVPEGGTINLSGSGSDPENRPLTYQWDLDGDGVFGESGAAAARGNENVSNPTFNAAGLDGLSTFSVFFRTVDEAGGVSAVAQKDVTITNVAPTLSISGAASVNERTTYTINLSGTDPGVDTIASWTVDWGDGTQADVWTGAAPSPTHAYQVGGQSYSIKVTATDGDGAYESAGWRLDTAFDTDGLVTTDLTGTGETANSIAIQPDGKLLVAGTANGDFALARYNPDGSPDLTFGTNGVATTDIGGGPDAGQSVLLEDNGNILVVGVGRVGAADKVVVTKYLPDGTLDSSFGSGGKLITITTFSGCFARATVQSDGKVVVATSNTTPFTTQSYTIARYNPDGTLDTSFGGGAVSYNWSTMWGSVIASLKVQADGKILLAGTAGAGGAGMPQHDFAVSRYNANGTLDATFGTGGVTKVSIGYGDIASAMSLQPDGKIVVAGSTGGSSPLGEFAPGAADFALIRLTSAGTLDTTFGTGGKTQTDLNGQYNVPSALAIDAGGKLVLAGQYRNSNSDVLVMLYSADGVLDTAFGANGALITDFAGGNDRANAIAVTADGNVAIAGFATTASGQNFALARYQPFTVVVHDASQAIIDGPSTIAEGSTYTLQLSSIEIPGHPITSWSIDWGDGNVQPITGNPASVNHVFADGAAEVVIQATAFDDLGPIESNELEVSVTNVAPSVSIGGSSAAFKDHAYTLALIAAGDPGQDTVSHWVIDWGDGTAPQQVSGSPPTVTHTFATAVASSHTITATAYDEDGSYPSANSRAVTVYQAQTLAVSGSERIDEGSVASLDLQASGAGEATTHWTVDWGDGSQSLMLGPQGTVTHRYLDGTQAYAVKAYAHNARGVVPAAPHALLVRDVARRPMIGGLRAADEGAPYTLTLDSGFEPGDDPVRHWRIDWGDGSGVQTIAGDPSQVAHVFPDGDASYSIVAMVVDDEGEHPAGTLHIDGGFGDDGLAVIGPTVNADASSALLIQPDGKVLVGGTGGLGPDFFVARFAADGTPDTSFGSAGRVVLDLGSTTEDRLHALALQPDGKIIAVGETQGAGPGDRDFALVRFESDGTLDTSFGTGGKVSSDWQTGAEDVARAVAVLGDGTILVAGTSTTSAGDFVVARYLSNGTLDAAFGTSGSVLIDVDGDDVLGGMTVQADGRIILAGASGGDVVLARLESDGDLDTTFSGDGKLTADLGGEDAGSRVVIQNGKIVVAGSSESDFALARFNSDGTLDTTFGDTGQTTTRLSGQAGAVLDLALAPSGDLVAVGHAGVARYTADGVLDPTFGSGGILSDEFADLGYQDAAAVAVDANGYTLVAGSIEDPLSATNVAVARYMPSNTFAVAVDDVAPILTVDGPATIGAGRPYDLFLSAADPGDDTVTTWTIDWGDGTTPQTVTGNPRMVSHVFTGAPITYTIEVTATNEDGQFAAAGREVQVVPFAVVADDSYTVIHDRPLAVSSPAAGVLGNDHHSDGVLTATLENDATHGTVALNSDGTFTYTPDEHFKGEDQFTYRATSVNGIDQVATVSISVTNAAPTVRNGTYTAPHGRDLVVSLERAITTLFAQDQDGDTLTLTPGTVSQGQILDWSSNGTFTYRPAAGFTGDATFTFTASDGVDGSASATITIQVYNTKPTAGDDTYSTGRGSELTVTIEQGLLGNDADADGDALSVQPAGYTQPGNGAVSVNPDGSFEYTPDASFTGADSFTYFVFDGLTSSVEAATVTIQVHNAAPVALDDFYSIRPNAPFTPVVADGLLANDFDPDNDTLTLSVIDGPDHGTVTNLAADGTFTYTPNVGFLGDDEFVYRIDDGSGTTSEATVVIRVGNSLPYGAADAYTLPHDRLTEIDAEDGVLANDFDGDLPEGVSLTVAVVPNSLIAVGSPGNPGTLDLNPDGGFSYTPPAGFVGVAYFDYTVSDGTHTNQARVELWVVNNPPFAAPDAYAVSHTGPTSIDAKGTGPIGSAFGTVPASLRNVNGRLYFVAGGDAGMELWKTDGTAAGTAVVKDIRSGAVGSNPDSLTPVNGRLFFVADDGVLGAELWTSDGTAAGTVMLKDIRSGAIGSSIANLTAVGDRLYFTADDGSDGSELWTSDGTAAGTVRVKDIQTGAAGSGASSLTALGGLLFFVADDGENGPELWKSDGTASGTVLVTDIVTGATGAGIGQLIASGGVIYFTADNGVSGQELWKSDGSASGTSLVKDIQSGVAGSDPSSLLAIGNKLYFAAADAANGRELWMTDGTEAGTALVRDIEPGASGSDPEQLVASNGTLYFTAADAAAGRELWTSNGTSVGTERVTDLRSGMAGSDPTNLTDVAGVLYFLADDGVAGRELWQISGDSPGAAWVQDLAPGAASAGPANLTTVGGTLFLTTADGKLWKSGPGGVLANDFDAEEDSLQASVVRGVAHGQLSFNADGSFTYTPGATFTGSDSFTYRITDGRLSSAETLVELFTVNTPPVAVNDTFVGSEDAAIAGGVLVNDSDAEGNALTSALAETPARGTVTLGANGQFTYEPDDDFFGLDSFTYTVSDGFNTSQAARVYLFVNAANDAPTGVAQAFTLGPGDELSEPTGTLLIGSDDIDGDELTTHLHQAAAHGTVTVNADGSFIYEHTGVGTSDSFTYRLFDGTAYSVPVTVTLTVANSPPVAGDLAFTVNGLGVLSVPAPVGALSAAHDADGDALTASLVSGPPAAEGALQFNADGSFVFTPASTFSGETSFIFSVSDGDASDTGTVTITGAVGAIVANSNHYTVHQGDVLNMSGRFNVLGNDWHAGGATLTVKLTDPAGDVLDLTGGTVTLYDDGDFVFTPDPGYVGTTSFTYRATTGTMDSDPVPVWITVTNQAPYATGESYSVHRGQVLSVPESKGVLINDYDLDRDDLKAVLIEDTQYGDVTLNDDGSFTYNPGVDAEGLWYVGTVSFKYVVNDGAENNIPDRFGIAYRVATITVRNNAPVATDNNYRVHHSDILEIDVRADDFDADADAFTVTLEGTGVQHGTLTPHPTQNGRYTYDPGPGYVGLDSFRYKVTDNASGGVSIADVVIDVWNNSPWLGGDTFTTHAQPLTITKPQLQINDTDWDLDTLDITGLGEGEPFHGTVVYTGGQFVYTPDAGYVGTDSFTYRVTDGAETRDVSVTVDVRNFAPRVANNYYRTPPGVPVTATPLDNDFDPDGDVVVFNLITGPQHGTFVPGTGTNWTYTPDANYNGYDSVVYTLSDGVQTSSPVSITFDVTVTGLFAAPGLFETEPGVPIPGNLVPDVHNPLGLPLTFDALALPTHGTVSLDPGGTFTYTPEATYRGLDRFTYTVTNGPQTSVGTVTLVMRNRKLKAIDNRFAMTNTPSAVLSGNVVTNDHVAGSGQPTVTPQTLTLSGGVLTLQASGQFTYDPNPGFRGVETFYYTAHYQGESDTAQVRIGVRNSGPVTDDDAITANEDQPTVIDIENDILDGDTDPDDQIDETTFTPWIHPKHGYLTQQGDDWVYKPVANFHGTDEFMYVVFDLGGNRSNPGKVTVTVAPQDDPTQAVADEGTTNEEQAITLNLLANDTDIDSTIVPANLTFAVVTQPQHAASNLTINAQGQVTYTPAANYHGDDFFEYKVTSAGGGWTQARVDLKILPINDAPSLNNDSKATTEDTPLTISADALVLNDTDVDNADGKLAPRFVDIASDPSNGTVTFSNGTFTYTPKANWSGTDSFTYFAYDDQGAGGTATVNIQVTAVNDAPVAKTDYKFLGLYNLPGPGPYNAPANLSPETVNVIANDTDVDGDGLTVTAAGAPFWGFGTPTWTSSSVTFTPTGPQWMHSVHQPYTITDGHGGTANGLIIFYFLPVFATEETHVEVAPGTATGIPRLNIHVFNFSDSPIIVDLSDRAATVSAKSGFENGNFNVMVHSGNPEDFTIPVTATWTGNVSGSLALDVTGDLAGSLEITGDLNLTVSGSSTGTVKAKNVTASAGKNLGNIEATQAINTLTASGSIGTVVAGTSIGTVDAGTSIGTVTAGTSIGTVKSKGDIAQEIKAGGDIGTVAAGTATTAGTLSAKVHTTAGNIQTISATRDITSPLIKATGSIGGVSAVNITGATIEAGTSVGAVTADREIMGTVNAGTTITSITARDIDGLISTGTLQKLEAKRDITGTVVAGPLNEVKAGRSILLDISSSGALGGVVAGLDILGELKGTSVASASAGRDLTGGVLATTGDVGAISAAAIGGIIKGKNVGTVVANTAFGRPGTISGSVLATHGTLGAVSAAGAEASISGTLSGKTGISSVSSGGMIDATITAAEGHIETISAGKDLNGSVSAKSLGTISGARHIGATISATNQIDGVSAGTGDVSGSVTSTQGAINGVSAGGAIGGSLSAQTNIGNVTAGKGIAGGITATTGTIGDITAGNSDAGGVISGAITAGKSIGDVIAYGSNQFALDIKAGTATHGRPGPGQTPQMNVDPTGLIEEFVVSDIEPPPRLSPLSGTGGITGNIHAQGGGIGSVIAHGSVGGTVTATGSIGEVWALGDVEKDSEATNGALVVAAWGSVKGNVTGHEDVVAHAYESIEKDVKSTTKNVNVAAHKEIKDGTIKGATAQVWTGGDILASVQADGAAEVLAVGAASGPISSGDTKSAFIFGSITNTGKLDLKKGGVVLVYGSAEPQLIDSDETLIMVVKEDYTLSHGRSKDVMIYVGGNVRGSMTSSHAITISALGIATIDTLKTTGQDKSIVIESGNLTVNQVIEAPAISINAAGNITATGSILGHESVVLKAFGDVSGTITADNGAIDIMATGAISGTYTGKFGVGLTALGNINVTSVGSTESAVAMEALGTLTATVADAKRGVTALAWDTLQLTVNASAKAAYAQLFSAKDITGSITVLGDVSAEAWGNIGATLTAGTNDAPQGGGNPDPHSLYATAFGDITGAMRAGKDATVFAGGNITGAVTADSQDAVAQGLGSITGAVTAGRDATVQAKTVTNTTTATGGKATVLSVAASTVTVKAKNGATVDGGSTLNATVTLTEAGHASVSSVGALTTTIEAPGGTADAFSGGHANVTISGGQTNGTANTVPVNVNVTSLGNLTGSVSASKDLSVVAWGNVSALTAKATGPTANLSIYADGTLAVTEASSTGALSANSMNAVSGTYKTLAHSSGAYGSLSIGTRDNINATINAVGDASVAAFGDTSTIAGSITAGNNANVVATGEITGTTTSNGGSLEVISLTAGIGSAATVNANKSATVFAAQTIAASVTGGHNASVHSLQSVTGAVTTTSADGSLDVSAVDTVSGTISAGGGATIYANLLSSSVTAGRDLDVFVKQGLAASVPLSSTNGSASVSSLAGIASPITAKHGATVFASSNLSGTVNAQQGDASITVGGSLSGQVHAGRDASVTVIGDLSGTIDADQSATISIFGDDNGTVDIGSKLSLTVLGNINNAVSAGQYASVQTLGSVTINASVSGGGGVSLSALGSVAGHVSSSQGSVDLTTWGDLTGNVTAGGDVIIHAGTSITNTIQAANNVSVTAGGNITGTIRSTGASATVMAMGTAFLTFDVNNEGSLTGVGMIDLTLKGDADFDVIGYSGVTVGLDQSVTRLPGRVSVLAAGFLHGSLTATGAISATSVGVNSLNVDTSADASVGALGHLSSGSIKAGGTAEVNAWSSASLPLVEGDEGVTIFAKNSLSAPPAIPNTIGMAHANSTQGEVFIVSGGVTQVDVQAQTQALVLTLGSLIGNITAEGDIRVQSEGNVTGALHSTAGNVVAVSGDQMNADIEAAGYANVTGVTEVTTTGTDGIDAVGGVNIRSYGIIDADVTGYDISLWARGDITGTYEAWNAIWSVKSFGTVDATLTAGLNPEPLPIEIYHGKLDSLIGIVGVDGIVTAPNGIREVRSAGDITATFSQSPLALVADDLLLLGEQPPEPTVNLEELKALLADGYRQILMMQEDIVRGLAELQVQVSASDVAAVAAAADMALRVTDARTEAQAHIAYSRAQVLAEIAKAEDQTQLELIRQKIAVRETLNMLLSEVAQMRTQNQAALEMASQGASGTLFEMTKQYNDLVSDATKLRDAKIKETQQQILEMTSQYEKRPSDWNWKVGGLIAEERWRKINKALEWIGMVFPPANLVNAVIYVARGNYGEAAFSLVSAFPGGFTVKAGGKLFAIGRALRAGRAAGGVCIWGRVARAAGLNNAVIKALHLGCFVAGTPVVIAEDGSLLAADFLPVLPEEEPNRILVGLGLMSLGIAALGVPKPRDRKRRYRLASVDAHGDPDTFNPNQPPRKGWIEALQLGQRIRLAET